MSKRFTLAVTMGPSAVAGSIAERRMRGAGGDELRYNIFQDQRGARIWGDGAAGGSAAIVSGRKDITLEMYGIVPPRQDVRIDVERI